MHEKEFVRFLERENRRLKEENRRLKKLIMEAGLSLPAAVSEPQLYYNSNPVSDHQSSAEGVLPVPAAEETARLFYKYFWGRTDVFAKRFVSKKKNTSGYFPQCSNFWRYQVCPKREGKRVKCTECSGQRWIPLTSEVILAHLKGEKADCTDVVGIYPLHKNGTCRFLVFDFDDHEKDGLKGSLENTNEDWKEEVDTLRRICRENQIDYLVERSRSGRGAHVWIFFEEFIPVSLARKFGTTLLDKGMETVSLKNFRYYDRMLPTQDSLVEGGLGNLIALPLQGRALIEGNSAFVDESWNPYSDQIQALKETKRLSESFLQVCIEEWKTDSDEQVDVVVQTEENQVNRSKPWEDNRRFKKEDVHGNMKIILSNLIYIDAENLKARIQNQIRKLAAFGNPVFYKNQAMHISNFKNSRYIYLGTDESGYIGIPRGLKDVLLKKCAEAEIPVSIDDFRTEGNPIQVGFTGQLRSNQEEAAEKMLKHETGILSAATAFGKTVVCCKLIAEKKTSTLILLESSALIEQWEKAIHRFLSLQEEPPEYQTKTGRVKRRKSAVGKLQGTHDSTTGIIDIAMVGSLLKKGEFHPRLEEYGMILVDECHHAASETIENVLRRVKAKYVYGVTATPVRGDGLEKTNYMIIGPIRHRFTSKERAEEQGIAHLVYPRFTRLACPRNEISHINEAYELVKASEIRNQQIIADVINCVENGRTPVILTKHKEHAKLFYKKLADCAAHVILMLGEDTKKQKQEKFAQLYSIPADESMVLIGTGKLIGEGFDYPRLDTLIMAAPVSGAQVVEQYAGRLNRDYEGKKNVIVYDYVDLHIPKLNNMYARRLKAYKQIGYQLCTVLEEPELTVNAIYDFESYAEAYENDLRQAKEHIVISSPQINHKKVEHFINILKPKQEQGTKATIVTWNPDYNKYGSTSYRMSLLEKLRDNGFSVQLMDADCRHYTVVDHRIVWYGNLNFLGKEDIEDNLMRVESADIAAELLAQTFRQESEIAMW